MSGNIIQLDALIIGQGLAGSILAWHLLDAGYNVLVIDNHRLHSASQVAAGLINPVRGKRLLRADDTDTCLPYAVGFYRQLEQLFNRSLYVPLAMLRLLKDQQQQDYFRQRAADPAYAACFDQRMPFDTNTTAALNLPFGAALQRQTGFLRVRELLDAMAAELDKQHCLLKQPFQHNELSLLDGAVQWQNYRARHSIFCEGYQAQQNPWFDWLPWQPAKGEILTLKSRQQLTKVILNRGNWLIPLSAYSYKTGATHSWDISSLAPSPESRRQLLADCQNMFLQQPELDVIRHEVGVRPTTRDKKPFIGVHPQHRQLAMFNGFGAHGSLMIPWYALQLAEFLKGDGELAADVDVQRHYPA